jgi:spermidine/putrescine transport system ATP-binding protein/putrescine transport system ATP-binding protein
MSAQVNPEFLRVAGVTKRYGSVIAADAVDLAIGAGELFALLGPSGCGKSTLLRMVAGFEYPDAGRIFIEGIDLTDAPPEKRPTNMVFQSYAIFPHLNVFDNVAYGLRKARLAQADLDQRVGDALAMMRLEGMGGRRANELSGGQRQRVALARALVRRPKVLLLDEPLGALDKRLREAMQIELRQLQKQVGITFLFVTHDQEEALSMADRVAVMSAGRVLQVARPRVLYEAPGSREVADFIGTMNFFDGEVVGVDGEGTIVDAGALGRMRVSNSPSFAKVGAKVLLALRPEKIALSDDSGLKGTLVAVTYLGERTNLRVAVEGLPGPIAVTVQNDSTAHHFAQTGVQMSLSWNPADFVVLER